MMSGDAEMKIMREVCHTFGKPTEMVCPNCGEKNIHAKMMSIESDQCKAHYMCGCGKDFYFEGHNEWPAGLREQ
jgi:hypothetical protein